MSARKHKVLPFGKDIVTGSVGGLLAKFWRTIMADCGLHDFNRYEYLMARYVQKAYNDPNRNEKASARASLSKELMKDSITWKTFIKGLNFLSVLRFELSITLHHANGKVTQHKVNAILDEIDAEGDKDGDS